MAIERTEYYTTKSAAVRRLKEGGWQADTDTYAPKNTWFRYGALGRASRTASVVRAKVKGLWAINFIA